jgi:hypothetical protein
VLCGGKTGERSFIQSSQPVPPGIRIRGTESDSGRCISAGIVPRAPATSRRPADPWIPPESMWPALSRAAAPAAIVAMLAVCIWRLEGELRTARDSERVLFGCDSGAIRFGCDLGASLMGPSGPRSRQAGSQCNDATQTQSSWLGSLGPPSGRPRECQGPQARGRVRAGAQSRCAARIRSALLEVWDPECLTRPPAIAFKLGLESAEDSAQSAEDPAQHYGSDAECLARPPGLLVALRLGRESAEGTRPETESERRFTVQPPLALCPCILALQIPSLRP